MYAYNPRRKTYQQLEESLVGARQWNILKYLLMEMELKKGEGPKQHWLIIGPRGFGKSHLLTLIYFKVKHLEKLKNKWIPLLFPEELRLENSLQKILKRVLRELIIEFQEENEPVCNELKRSMDLIGAVPDRERTDLYFSLIDRFFEQTGKHVLLLIENLQYIFGKKLPVIEQKKLRAFLQTSDSLLIVGSATTLFEALYDYSHPFFHYFHVWHLQELGFEDMKTLTRSLLSQNKHPGLAESLPGGDAWLKTLYSLTGGNPRIAALVADILSAEVPEEIIDVMDRILDELTPYFLSVVEGIPEYLLQIINVLAAYKPAQSPSEIAQHIEAPQATVRKYLKQLKESGHVRLAFSKGKSSYYCLSEYLYRTWFQMRDSGLREESRWTLELLLMLYSKESRGEDPGTKIDAVGNEYVTETASGAGYIRSPRFWDDEDNIEATVLSYLRYIKTSFAVLNLTEAVKFNLKELTKKLPVNKYIKRFYESGPAERPGFELNILLVLLNQYDVVQECIMKIFEEYSNIKTRTGEEIDLLTFTIKLCILIELSEGNSRDVLRLIEMYSNYIKSLETSKEKESEILEFFQNLFIAQDGLKINREGIEAVFQQIRDHRDIPFNDIIRKVWICLSMPDSVQARVYMVDKATAEIVGRFRKD
jgi:hypothetical protein